MVKSVGEAIALLIASKQGPYSVEERLDALVDVLEAADEDRLDYDAMEVLLESGLSRDNRRALVDMFKYGRFTLPQLREAVEAAKSHQAQSKSEAS
jgi:hypothetical protein